MESFIVNHKSPLPLHIQVETILRNLIELPEYQNGKMFPNEVHMAKKTGHIPKYGKAGNQQTGV